MTRPEHPVRALFTGSFLMRFFPFLNNPAASLHTSSGTSAQPDPADELRETYARRQQALRQSFQAEMAFDKIYFQAALEALQSSTFLSAGAQAVLDNQAHERIIAAGHAARST